MSLSQLQERITQLERSEHRAITTDQRAMFLATESGEVLKEVLKLDGLYGKDAIAGSTSRIGKELADVIWNTCELATRLQLNLDDEMSNMLARYVSRKFGAP